MPRFSAFLDLGNLAGTTYTSLTAASYSDYHAQPISFNDDGYNSPAEFYNSTAGTNWMNVNAFGLVRVDGSVIASWRLPAPLVFIAPMRTFVPERSICISITQTPTVAAGQSAGGVITSFRNIGVPSVLLAGADYNTQPWY